jgi:hypothetical protein
LIIAMVDVCRAETSDTPDGAATTAEPADGAGMARSAGTNDDDGDVIAALGTTELMDCGVPPST